MKCHHPNIQKWVEHHAQRELAPITERLTLEALVDRFAAEMKRKLIDKMHSNAPWAWTDHERLPTQELVDALQEHIEKGDPIDVANFTLFWWNRLPDPGQGETD